MIVCGREHQDRERTGRDSARGEGEQRTRESRARCFSPRDLATAQVHARLSHARPSSPFRHDMASKLRIAFIHPDLGIGLSLSTSSTSPGTSQLTGSPQAERSVSSSTRHSGCRSSDTASTSTPPTTTQATVSRRRETVRYLPVTRRSALQQ